MAIDFKAIEAKWIPKYEGYKAFEAEDLDATREKQYALVEFPYPSGAGLHVGHAFSMTGTDVYARFSRMKGKNVLFPMGWDSFGLPTENFAIKSGIKPQVATKQNTDTFRKQMKQLGFSFDWRREIDTTFPEYYKWTQWIFVKLFEKGLAEKKEMPINWCPKDKIGLANEEVVNGKCERCGTQVERRTQSQWIVKITAYADRLIEGLKNTNFIEKVKAAQINWIDRKEGMKVRFKLNDEVGVGNGDSRNVEYVEVFTSRPDTLEGATFMVVAPEHPLVNEIATPRHGEARNDEVVEYVEKVKRKSEMERTDLAKEKTGVFSGLYAVNPLTGKEIPIWIADYVLITYGTGAIMSVPSHDERDGEFAKKYKLPIDWKYKPDTTMAERIEKEGWGEKAVGYHLRDWIFSRQHYWGEPIPMIWCEKDGWVAVPEDQLPVRLPEVEKYQPTDTGESPLASIQEWVKTVCPRCGGLARRETDTMPNWAGSDWYFLRFLDPKNDNAIADMEKQKYWLPVDLYVGGDEHNTLHLLYSRFIYQFLWDLGAVPKEYPEPYKKRISHGIILGPDGARMSKSKGNVILPDVLADMYGADALRTYMMFMGPFDATMAWSERSLMGVRRFLNRFYDYVEKKAGEARDEESEEKVKVVINRLVKEVGEDIVEFKYNTAIAKLMTAINDLEVGGKIGRGDLRSLVQVLAPFAPFVAEELWEKLGGEFSVHGTRWPGYEEKYLVTETVTISVQVNGKLRGTVVAAPAAVESAVRMEAEKQEKIQKYLTGGIKNVVYIQGKTINFVV